MEHLRPIRISTDTMVRGILLVFATYLAFRLRDTLLLVLVAIVLATFVEAGVRFLGKYKIKRLLAVPVIFTVVIAFLFTLFYSFVPTVFRELSGMITILAKYIPENSTISSQSIEGATQFVNTISKHASLADLMTSIKNSTAIFSQGATSIIGSTFGGILDGVLVIVMAFYLSIQEKGMSTFLRILTPAKHERYVIDLWERTQLKIGLWFQGQLLLALFVGAVTFVVLALMGVEYAFLIGLISGIAELIPFGIIFAAIPAILFAVIGGGVLLGVKVMVYYIIIQQIESYVLSPVVARRVVGIPPLVVLLSFVMGITLAGFWGALIAIPVAVFVLEYMGDVEKQKLIPIIKNPEIR